MKMNGVIEDESGIRRVKSGRYWWWGAVLMKREAGK
jgi:hypothetical protein